ncbi:polyprenyl diphosphate synthase [Streptomyces sp. CB02959]|uniref:polyprenyl synthetase family protein n=1 Tax=Streptomyces sp. CB02959 TaxID=2020330 RepID=UPI000C27EE49|nr:polyprenyl synthetase family protein [Streptomyces sp. CB02959]PJN32307.1 polyprenyl diphosphate synthase [Streptomyces sp. CB02959]
MNAPAGARRIRDTYWPALTEAVRTLHGQDHDAALILGYHLGLNDADGTPEAGDNGLASTLCLAGLGARAVHATAEQAAACALAVELTKDHIQLEDDILDEDLMRRGRPAAWQAFGTPRTILAIDLTRALAFDLLTVCGPQPLRAARHLQVYTDMVARGQAADRAAETRPWLGEEQVTLAEYEQTIEAKGAGMVVAALTLGAVLTGTEPTVLDTLTRAGIYLGKAWQIFDDLTDIWSAEGPRPVSNDLARGKKSYPVVIAAASASPDAGALADLLATRPDTALGTAAAARLLEACGGKAACEARVSTLHGAALQELTRPDYFDRGAVADLIELASLIGTRGNETTLTLSTPTG